jgi:hypothetical protein
VNRFATLKRRVSDLPAKLVKLGESNSSSLLDRSACFPMNLPYGEKTRIPDGRIPLDRFTWASMANKKAGANFGNQRFFLFEDLRLVAMSICDSSHR